MNAKISVFVVCIETIICLLLYNLDDCTFKDTQREKAPLNQTPALTKSMNIDIWDVGISNQLPIRGSQTETNLQKYTVVTGKTPFFLIGLFCTHHS